MPSVIRSYFFEPKTTFYPKFWITIVEAILHFLNRAANWIRLAPAGILNKFPFLPNEDQCENHCAICNYIIKPVYLVQF